jgi:hypothetical protein
MGAVLSVFGLFFGGAGLAGLASLVLGHALDRTDWFPWVAAAVALLVGFWCGETGWRLMTGYERRDGGLLSPLALIVVGMGCVAASIAGVVSRGPTWFGWLRLVPFALFCFGLARFRWQRQKPKSEAA